MSRFNILFINHNQTYKITINLINHFVNKNMVKLISFGTCSFHLIYPLIYIFIISAINKFKVLIDSTIQKEFYFFKTIGVLFLAEMTAGCLYYFDQYLKQKDDKNSEDQLHFLMIEPDKKNSSILKYSAKIIMLILFLSILDLIASIIYYLSQNNFNKLSLELRHLMMYMQFFVYIYLSINILHQQIHCHHYTSIAISFLGLILVMIPLVETNENIQWSQILLMLSVYLQYALIYVIDKWLMQMRGINPYYLLLVQGVFSLIVFAILLIPIFTYCPYNIPLKTQVWYCKDIYFFSQLDFKGVYFLLVEYIRFIIVNICVIKILNHFTPLYFLSICFLSYIINWSIEVMLEKTYYAVPTLIGCLIIMFAFLIYNETIIFHIWGLDYYTVKMMTQRIQAEEEKLSIN